MSAVQITAKGVSGIQVLASQLSGVYSLYSGHSFASAR
jgi:hypothetical protein